MKGDKEIYKRAKGFDKNPQNINRKGQPKKNYPELIAELKDKGYKAPIKSEYFEMIGMLLVMDEKDLTEFENDKTKPYWIRTIAMDLTNKNMRSKITSDYRDWMFGKATQKIDMEAKGSIITIKECQKDV